MIKEYDTLEDASVRAKRLTEVLRGLLKEELREQGGTEAFVRWIRSDRGDDLSDGSDGVGLFSIRR